MTALWRWQKESAVSQARRDGIARSGNEIALSPAEKSLYVVNSFQRIAPL
jgi:hypothetical protein